MNPESTLENLRRLLLEQRWIEGTRTLEPSSLLSLLYGDQARAWGLPAKGLKALKRFGQEYGEAAPLTELVFRYLSQVHNGGHSQWFGNGYATDNWNGTDVLNVHVRDWMIDQFRISPLMELPALSAAMEICARAHPTMRAEELSRLDDALSEVIGEAQSGLDRWLEAWLDLKVEKVTDPDERFARSSSFVEQLLDVPNAPRIRLSMKDIERMNQVDRAFTKLFRLPTLKEVADECGLEPEEIERFYEATKALHGERMVKPEAGEE
ncbi:hypothetical protein BO221_24505 [Archangium sp. Cb G35]|uniref:hypothetical protein n=1 Tax=Archangium sp. Cb G35 TaxID=1920190 RepID=UPI0009364E7E|nr:hypothetical protein [Archangium sp. Cb G35]OJT21918.1 hypothetical protein BO221_24505 [Archangium sp. Cb G35]